MPAMPCIHGTEIVGKVCANGTSNGNLCDGGQISFSGWGKASMQWSNIDSDHIPVVRKIGKPSLSLVPFSWHHCPTCTLIMTMRVIVYQTMDAVQCKSKA
mmetsp:Transcript_8390/g.13606  ORF Transcript_8390/g.13606 Transcript_8390/m.13606 type:complete len:100 (+) Transcript_8390:861-1160(+)